MKFWKQFPKHSVLRQLIFVLVLFAVLIPLAIWDSNTQVKVELNESSVGVRSDKYNLSIRYDEIVSAELTALAEPGEKVTDGYDNDIIRCGIWKNDVWGEYYINADLDATDCIMVKTKDGKTFVFSCKNNQKTAEIYEQLQGYLN